MQNSDQGAMMQAEFAFVAGKTPKRSDGLAVTVTNGNVAMFRFGAKNGTMFSSVGCDSCCEGLTAEGFGA